MDQFTGLTDIKATNDFDCVFINEINNYKILNRKIIKANYKGKAIEIEVFTTIRKSKPGPYRVSSKYVFNSQKFPSQTKLFKYIHSLLK